MNLCDLIIHLDEPLEDTRMRELESLIQARAGVVSAHFSARYRHLMTVAYDCDAMRARDLVRQIETNGLRAQAVGL